MPFKCTNCNTVAQTENEQECGCDNPNFLSCVTNHYIHSEGTGKKYCTQKTPVGFPPNQKIVEETLSLCCDADEKVPNTTRIRNQVTCPKCLVFVKALEDEAEHLVSS